MKSLIFLSLFIFTSTSFAFEDMTYLRGGISINNSKLGVLENVDGENEDESNGWGVSTQFGYKWTKWEVIAASTVSFGKVEDLTFQAGGQDFTGSGSYQNVVISPMLKYITDYSFRDWHLYFTAGPLWSAQTINLKKYVISGQLPTDEFKLFYESRGWQFGFGIDEIIPNKEMHPVFLEVIFSYSDSYKVSIVDTSDFVETNILSTEEANQDIKTYSLTVNFGMIMF
jgi:hypothetical protein